MRDFIYHAPTTIDEALALLDEHGEDARPIAGGTAMVNLLKQNMVLADHLVGLGKLPGLRGVSQTNGSLHIGALSRHREVELSPEVLAHSPLLAEAYSKVATVRVRNMATVGGGLTHADPAQDPPPSLMVLDAHVVLTSSKGTRELPVSDLFVDYYESALEPGELLTELVVPQSPKGAKTVYLKFLPRTEDDYATVSVAALATVENGICQDIRVALGAVGPTPIRATAVEAALKGQQVTPDAVRAAADAVADQVDPLTDFRGSDDYKRDMAVVFTRRALEQVLLAS
ncbi:MAG: xanthine dehydrogenase family protein subunit M [SAR202 cluster bacterium]|nr:xanthine dehydrogenase family protein subunit M [SAR202 cluster bacterium]|tara:strand:+ start:232 stop:1089 length:858 start_codon:yes stop_codon:yes gene_type:complete